MLFFGTHVLALSGLRQELVQFLLVPELDAQSDSLQHQDEDDDSDDISPVALFFAVSVKSDSFG